MGCGEFRRTAQQRSKARSFLRPGAGQVRTSFPFCLLDTHHDDYTLSRAAHHFVAHCANVARAQLGGPCRRGGPRTVLCRLEVAVALKAQSIGHITSSAR
jgi:hypothetical protein